MSSNCEDDVKNWSRKVESARKDVECTFGILKIRFKVLKYPLRFRKTVVINDIFRTCCVFNNLLLFYDNRDGVTVEEIKLMEQQNELDEEESNILKSVYYRRKELYSRNAESPIRNLNHYAETLTLGSLVEQLRLHFSELPPVPSDDEGLDLRKKLVKHMEIYRELKHKD